MSRTSCLPRAHAAPEPGFRFRDLDATRISAAQLPGFGLSLEEATVMRPITTIGNVHPDFVALMSGDLQVEEPLAAALISPADLEAEETEARAARIRALRDQIESDGPFEIGEAIAILRALLSAGDDAYIRPLQECVEELEAENDYIEAHRG